MGRFCSPGLGYLSQSMHLGLAGELQYLFKKQNHWSFESMSVLVHPTLDQRHSPRTLVYAAGTIAPANDGQSDRHIAWVKDINKSGLCLFTRYRPEIGTPVCVTLDSDPLRLGVQQQYLGTVVRIQEFGSQAALAVAVRFAGNEES